jgi:hypothetical protein
MYLTLGRHLWLPFWNVGLFRLEEAAGPSNPVLKPDYFQVEFRIR